MLERNATVGSELPSGNILAVPCLEKAEVRHRVSGAKAGSCLKGNRPKNFGMTTEDKATVTFNLTRVDIHSYVEGGTGMVQG